jgi:hypothetical protein
MQFDGKPVNRIVRSADHLKKRVALLEPNFLHTGLQATEVIEVPEKRPADCFSLPRL